MRAAGQAGRFCLEVSAFPAAASLWVCPLLRVGRQAGTVISALGRVSRGKHGTTGRAAFPGVSVACPDGALLGPLHVGDGLQSHMASAIFLLCGREHVVLLTQNQFVLQSPTWNMLICRKFPEREGLCHKP